MSDPIYPPNFVPDEEWLRKKAAQKKFEEEQAEQGRATVPPKEPKTVVPVRNPKPDPTSDAAKWERGAKPEPEPEKTGKSKEKKGA